MLGVAMLEVCRTLPVTRLHFRALWKAALVKGRFFSHDKDFLELVPGTHLTRKVNWIILEIYGGNS